MTSTRYFFNLCISYVAVGYYPAQNMVISLLLLASKLTEALALVSQAVGVTCDATADQVRTAISLGHSLKNR